MGPHVTQSTFCCSFYSNYDITLTFFLLFLFSLFCFCSILSCSFLLRSSFKGDGQRDTHKNYEIHAMPTKNFTNYIYFQGLITPSSATLVVCLTTHRHVRLWSSSWIPGPDSGDTPHHDWNRPAGRPRGLHGWVRSCGTPDSLLLTHGLSLTTGQHGGRYDP